MTKRCIYKESGRSMVEMLAVLAIIGVLTIAGIVGYSYAMQLFREAETYDDVSVTVAGSRTWPILDHYGRKTVFSDGDNEKNYAYVIPIREVVSKVNYSSEETAEEAGIELKPDEKTGIVTESKAREIYNQRREKESFFGKVMAPVWVRAESEEAWTVRVVGLSKKMCKNLVSKRELGYEKAYIALRTDKNTPKDPIEPDEHLVTDYKYTNEQMADPTNVETLCSKIDELNSDIPPVQKYLKVAPLPGSNKIAESVASIYNSDRCSNPKSIECLAGGAAVDEKPLQTLVLWWGKTKDIIIPSNPDGCIPGRPVTYDAPDVLSPECCKVLHGVYLRTWDGDDVCCLENQKSYEYTDDEGSKTTKAIKLDYTQPADCKDPIQCTGGGKDLAAKVLTTSGAIKEDGRCCTNCFNNSVLTSVFCCDIKQTYARSSCKMAIKASGGGVTEYDNKSNNVCGQTTVACCGEGTTARGCKLGGGTTSERSPLCCAISGGTWINGGTCCTAWKRFSSNTKSSQGCKGQGGSDDRRGGKKQIIDQVDTSPKTE